ncbi:MAG: CPBP family intramembrane metalloprotease [Candidatus Obscuribacterales bacterium]|nr:CPBP family intramembrane metalloprotease [Candidatus Obscuribacterales bacterium]
MRDFLVKLKKTLNANRLACLLLVLSAIGFVFAQTESSTAFPSASISTTVPREKILEIAAQWANEIGFSTAGTVSSIDFAGDDDGKTFLERELSQAKANELMKSGEAPVWFWQCHFKKPLQIEDSSVQISPSGQLVNVTREIENDTKLPVLSPAEAKSTAIKFVEEKVKRELAGWKLIEEKQDPKVGRTDYELVWEDTAQDFKGARNRITVKIAGNVVSMYDITLHTPESWERSYETMRSYNSLFYTPASVVFALLGLFCIVRFGIAIAKHELNWRFSSIVGGVFAATSALDSLNSLPRWLAYYNPDQSLTAYYLSRATSIVSGMVLSFIAAAVLAGVTELCYRKFFAEKIALPALFSRDAVRTKQMLESILMGFAVFGISQGYQIGYYMMGSQLGYWCPLGVDNYQVLSALAPWFSAFSVGLSASLMEEAMYRVICLGLLQKVTRNFQVANIIQAAAWGFMHSTYPQQPAYARGVELTIAGIFSGWVLKRFGLPACVLSHYMFDAFWGVSMLKNAPPEVYCTAIIPFVPVFALLAYSLYMRRKHGALDTEVVLQKQKEANTETSAGLPAAEAAIVKGTFTYTALSGKSRFSRCAIAVGLLALAAFAYKSTGPSVGEHYKPLSVGREKSIEIARDYLQNAKVNLDGYSATAAILESSEGGWGPTYLKEKVGAAETKRLLEVFGRNYSWNVTFTKPLEPNQYSVMMDESGNVVTTNFTLDEKAPGAKLDEKQARTIAENFIKKYRKCYLPIQYENTSKVALDNRTDYSFKFSVPKLKAGDAKFMLGLNVIGDQPSDMSHDWQVPDKWTRERQHKSPFQEALSVFSSVFAVVAICCFLKFVVELLQRRQMEWRAPLICAGIACLVGSIECINQTTMIMSNYDTTTPLTSYLFQYWLGKVGGILGQSAGVFFVVSIFLGGMKRFYPELGLKSFAKLAFCNDSKVVQATQRAMWIDATVILFLSVSIAALLSGTGSALSLQFGHASIPQEVTSLGSLNFAEEYSFLAGSFSAIQSMFLGAMFLACLCLTWKRFCGSPRVAIPVFAAALVLQAGNHYPIDSVIAVAAAAAAGGVGWWFCRESMRNPLIPIMAFWLIESFSFATVLKHSKLYSTEVTAVLLMFSLPFLWILWIQLNPKKLVETLHPDRHGEDSAAHCDTIVAGEGMAGNAGV